MSISLQDGLLLINLKIKHTMKKIIFCLMLLASFKAESQVIDTTIKSIKAVKIQPFTVQVNYPLKDTITHIGIEGTGFVLNESCTIRVILLAKGKNIAVIENQIINGEEYLAWEDDLYPFKIIAARMGFAFKNN